MSDKGRRYNKNKNRVELIPTFAKNQLADVYTKGAHKYSIYKDKFGVDILGKDIPFEKRSDYELIDDASANWRKGLPWMETIGSVERHIEAWKAGEDVDEELQTLHLANAAWGLFTLLEFYKIYPQGDNRLHSYLNTKRIGLDIDEVLADFIGHWTKYHGQEIPETWNFDRNIKQKFESLKDDKNFWMSVPVLTKPQDIPFEPTCYITSRWIDNSWTEEWLDKHGFPQRPVFSVKNGSKVDVAKEQKLDLYVDDRFENFVEMNNAGVCCYLFDAPHNRRYDVGYKRIKSLKELL